MKPRTVVRIFSLALGLSVGACVSVDPGATSPATTTGLTAQISDRLYFGRSIPGGGSVSDQSWASFVTEVVTPRSPSGLTVWHAEGQWRGSGGAITHEESFVLEVVHPDDAASERAIREITGDHKRRFSQEAVLRVHDHVEVSF
jgi:hypothetical protein